MSCEKRKHKWTEGDGLRCAVCGATRNARQARHVRVERGIYRNTVTGSFEITYTEDSKQVWQTITGGLKDAQRARRNVLGKHDRGERAAPSRQTVAQVADEWLAAQAGRLRPRTLQTYRTHLREHVLSSKLGRDTGQTLGSRKVNAVRAHDVARLIGELTGKGLQPWSVHGVLSPLSALFQYAILNEWADRNPVRALERGQRPQIERRSRRILSGEEIGKLLAATGERYRLALATATYSGVRLGELLGLTWADVDFDAGLLHVRKQLGRDGVRVAPKTPQAVRGIVLMPQLEPLLKAHREEAFALGRARPTDPVFASEAGTPLSSRNLTWRGLEKAAVSAGLMPSREERKRATEEGSELGPPVTMHTLRRTFASHLILDLKLDAVQVAKQMGHAKPSITQDAYADLFDQARHHDEIREAMGASAFGAVLATSSATRTGGDTRRNPGAAGAGKVAQLRVSATGGDR
ncbi:MAG TPA: tyrosine-type recombinase/integrase [Gaiellaceae bacterium]